MRTTAPDSTKSIAYLRVSSAGQVSGDGFARQREAIAARADADGYQVVDEFRDEGVSGTLPLSERPGLSALLERIIGNGVRVVLVERADRLARDLVEAELILREFQSLGVRIIEAEGGNDLAEDDSPTAKLIRQVLGAVAEFEKSALVAKLRVARVRTGRLGGRPPYPPEVVRLAKKLRRRVVKGRPWSHKRIAAALTDQDVPTQSGRPWAASTVRDLLAS